MKRTTVPAWRLGAGAALGTALLLLWVIGAVGLLGRQGDPADLMYGGVLAVGVLGALIARLRPGGMARALVVTAFAQALVAGTALMVGKQHAEVSSTPEIVFSNGLFVAFWLAAAGLFRSAGRGPLAEATPPARPGRAVG